MIFLLLIGSYLLLCISFFIKEKTLGLISAMLIMSLGVYVAINGIIYINNFLVQAFAIISICFGSYILIVGSLIDIKESGI